MSRFMMRTVAARCMSALVLVLGCFAEENPAGGDDDASTTGSGETSGASASTTTAGSASGGSAEAEATSIEPGSESADETSAQTEGGSSTAETTSATETGSATCGDGTQDPGEECDDSNTDPGDGCHSDCTVYKAVFVTKAMVPGTEIGGLAGAHAICQGEAQEVGLAGEFKAWLSTTNIAAMTELFHSPDPYRLVDGTLVAFSWGDLTDGVLTTQIDLTADGTPVGAADIRVWTGTGASGEAIPPTCGDWSMDAISGHSGRVNWVVADDWTDFVDLGCSESHRLYCFEQ
jgi:cysteine-rich repeat protein